VLVSSRVPALDEFLWRMDANFGYPQIPLVKFVLDHAAAYGILHLCYLALSLVGVLVYLALPNETAIRRRYCIASALGLSILLLYAICPAGGPYYLFRENLPYSVPAIAVPHARFMNDVSYNCAPSGHVAWTLVLAWFAHRYCGRIARVATAVFLVLTVLATLAMGEHYVIDLVLSAPFAAGMWALSDRQWLRGAVCWLFLVVWLFALRWGWAQQLPHTAVWALTAVTLMAPWWRIPRLRSWIAWRHPLPAFESRIG